MFLKDWARSFISLLTSFFRKNKEDDANAAKGEESILLEDFNTEETIDGSRTDEGTAEEASDEESLYATVLDIPKGPEQPDSDETGYSTPQDPNTVYAEVATSNDSSRQDANISGGQIIYSNLDLNKKIITEEEISTLIDELPEKKEKFKRDKLKTKLEGLRKKLIRNSGGDFEFFLVDILKQISRMVNESNENKLIRIIISEEGEDDLFEKINKYVNKNDKLHVSMNESDKREIIKKVVQAYVGYKSSSSQSRITDGDSRGRSHSDPGSSSLLDGSARRNRSSSLFSRPLPQTPYENDDDGIYENMDNEPSTSDNQETKIPTATLSVSKQCVVTPPLSKAQKNKSDVFSRVNEAIQLAKGNDGLTINGKDIYRIDADITRECNTKIDNDQYFTNNSKKIHVGKGSVALSAEGEIEVSSSQDDEEAIKVAILAFIAANCDNWDAVKEGKEPPKMKNSEGQFEPLLLSIQSEDRNYKNKIESIAQKSFGLAVKPVQETAEQMKKMYENTDSHDSENNKGASPSPSA